MFPALLKANATDANVYFRRRVLNFRSFVLLWYFNGSLLWDRCVTALLWNQYGTTSTTGTPTSKILIQMTLKVFIMTTKHCLSTFKKIL